MTKKPKVLYVYKSPREAELRGYLQGQHAGSRLYGLPHMAEFGIDAAVSDKGFQRRLLYYCGQVLHRCWLRTGLRGLNMSQALQLRSWAKDYDLLFATTDSVGFALEMLKWAGYLRTPIVHGAMGLMEQLTEKQGSLGFHMARRLLGVAERVVCLQRTDYEGMCGLMGQANVDLVHFGVCPEFFQPSTQDEGFVLAVGRDLRRDWELLLRVAAQVDGRFEIVCQHDGLKDLPIPPNVHVQYDIPMATLRELYAKASFVVVPTKRTTCFSGATVIFEAMAMGKPVIATWTISWRGYPAVQDGKHCCFVPAGEACSLALAIRRLRADRKFRRYLGRNARRLVERCYNARRYAKELAAVFHTAVS